MMPKRLPCLESVQGVQPKPQVGIPLPAHKVEGVTLTQNGGHFTGRHPHIHFPGGNHHVCQPGVQRQVSHEAAVCGNLPPFIQRIQVQEQLAGEGECRGRRIVHPA